MVGAIFEPDSEARGSVVVLSGSGGGIPDGYAERLADAGLRSFALAYFGLPGLPSALVEIAVEDLERGIAWFSTKHAGGGPVDLMGSSKGAELALVLGAYLGDRVRRIVAVAPTSVAWYGLDQSDPSVAGRPSWTCRGAPVPFLPYAETVQPLFGTDGIRVDVCYELSHYGPSDVEKATIPVEQCRGPILLLSGSDDHMWPAAIFADRVVERMSRAGGGGEVVNKVYAGAGHAFLHREFFANVGNDGRPLLDFGGTVSADEAARADAWPRIVSFLAELH